MQCIFHPEKKSHARGMCGACYVKNRYHTNPSYRESNLAVAKAWHEANPERTREIEIKSKKKACPLKKREYLLRRKYGITNADFDKMLDEQGGVCAICFVPPAEGKKLHVDHNHSTGAVRGLLCYQCNWYLSKVDSDLSILARIAAYTATPE